MQAVLGRTLQHAKDTAKTARLEKPTPSMMELKLIQSKLDIENPPGGCKAELLK